MRRQNTRLIVSAVGVVATLVVCLVLLGKRDSLFWGGEELIPNQKDVSSNFLDDDRCQVFRDEYQSIRGLNKYEAMSHQKMMMLEANARSVGCMK